MAILCRDYRLLFIMAPRTGCTAVGEALVTELKGQFLPPEDILAEDGHIRVQRKHSTLRQLRDAGLLTADEASQLYKFTTVRNPFDSLVSLYVKQRSTYQPLIADPNSWVHRVKGYTNAMAFAKNNSFDAWVLRSYSDPKWKWWLNPLRRLRARVTAEDSSQDRFTDGVDFVMRFESLQSDFNEVLSVIGVDRPIEIPQINKTPERSQRDYRSHYSTRARRAVTYHLQEMLDRYGYRF